jgi:hypothetical protein
MTEWSPRASELSGGVLQQRRRSDWSGAPCERLVRQAAFEALARGIRWRLGDSDPGASVLLFGSGASGLAPGWCAVHAPYTDALTCNLLCYWSTWSNATGR